MLGLRAERASERLRRRSTGLLLALPDMSAVGTATTAYVVRRFHAPTHNSTFVLSGYVQRSYLMEAGLAISLPSSNAGSELDVYVDNGALLSRMGTWLGGAEVFAPIAIYENFPHPLKISITPTLFRVWTPGHAALEVPNAIDYQQMSASTYYHNANGGIAQGNRYDCYFTGIVACKDNLLRFRNLKLGTSIRVTVNAGAPVLLNVDATGRAQLEMGEVLFPARVLVESFRGPNGTLTKYAYQVLPLVYGGDVWQGRESDIAPRTSGPALARGAWILTASYTSPFYGGINGPKDGSLYDRWASGGPVNPATSWFKVDTGVAGAPRLVGSLRINNTLWPAEVPLAGSVLVSLDNVTWTPVATWGLGDISAGVLLVIFAAPVLTRYVKIIPTAPPSSGAGGEWSIAELDLYADVP